jgi:hypothetical protein
MKRSRTEGSPRFVALDIYQPLESALKVYGATTKHNIVKSVKQAKHLQQNVSQELTEFFPPDLVPMIEQYMQVYDPEVVLLLEPPTSFLHHYHSTFSKSERAHRFTIVHLMTSMLYNRKVSLYDMATVVKEVFQPFLTRAGTSTIITCPFSNWWCVAFQQNEKRVAMMNIQHSQWPQPSKLEVTIGFSVVKLRKIESGYLMYMTQQKQKQKQKQKQRQNPIPLVHIDFFAMEKMFDR